MHAKGAADYIFGQLENCVILKFMDPRSLLRCPAVRANEAEQNKASNRFFKSCEPLLCSESILGFIESDVIGVGS